MSSDEFYQLLSESLSTLPTILKQTKAMIWFLPETLTLRLERNTLRARTLWLA